MADFQQRASCAQHTERFNEALSKYLFVHDRLHTTDDESDSTLNMLSDALAGAEQDLMAVPANNVHELRIKVDITWGDLGSIPPTSHVLAIFSDFQRLTGGGASPIFNAERWLAWFERSGGMWVVRDGEPILLTPEGKDLNEVMDALALHGGRAAVLDLILMRHNAKEA